MKTFHNEKPNKITPIGGGKYTYCYDIKEVHDDEVGTYWESESVTIGGPLTCDKIIAAVLTDVADINREQKLINEYNALVIGITDGNADDARQRYADFLRKRSVIKAMVEADCKELGIL